MKKRLVSMMLTAALCVGTLAGCGSKSEEAAAPASDAATEAPAAAAEAETGGDDAEAPAASGDKLTVAVSIRSMSSEYHMQYVAGAQAFVDSLPEGTAEVQVLPCDSNDDKQINDIKALIASKGDNMILFVDPNNAPNITSIAELCEEAGVYWVSAWNTPEGINPLSYKYWVAHQACDGVQQGYDLAVNIFDRFKEPGKGKILVLEGMLANTANVERMEGLNKALEEYPDIEVLDDQAGDWDTKKALSITETWLAKYDDIDGIWCACDDMALGVVQALKAKGLDKKVLVTGNDGTTDAVNAVESGDITVTIANNGWLQGGYSVAYAYAAKTGKIDPSAMAPEERMFYTNGVVITADNVADYKKEYVESTPVYDYNDLSFPVARPMEIN